MRSTTYLHVKEKAWNEEFNKTEKEKLKKRTFTKKLSTFFIAAIVAITILGCSFYPTKIVSDDLQGKYKYIYSVKFACVNEVGPAAVINVEAPFEPAIYRTVVNVHNFFDNPVKFTKKAVLARSQDLERGVISEKVTEELLYDQALAIDCIDIRKLFGGFQPIGDGFLVIESENELDVVAVYTAEIIEEVRKDSSTTNTFVIIDKNVNGPGPEPGHEPFSIPFPTILTIDPDTRLPIDPNSNLPSNELEIQIRQEEFSGSNGGGVGYGIGVGVGTGVGTGVGVGAGVSIDVEYIQPKIIRKNN